jgi:hypothetical protein
MPAINLRLTDDELEAIRQAAQADSRSINAWCKLTLLAAIAGVKTVKATILPGHDLIDQKRDDKGKFVKRD